MGLNLKNSPEWESDSLGYINCSVADQDVLDDLNAIPGLKERAWERFEKYMLDRTINLDPKISKLVDEHFWELT